MNRIEELMKLLQEQHDDIREEQADIENQIELLELEWREKQEAREANRRERQKLQKMLEGEYR
jgi:hypothetical protein